ncbi:FBD-associated F-box protein At4g10400-like isoform X1 [Daucus carota subsp. sativus]|uniref:FBD-associated F-box protein At4g10400-like isoform X1 n=1 Tax=Daucus carota subsp. sativus TaxID=79200 RepID=UPI0007F03E36|nr:PREDICTED: FBD-associated F-box protein At4g10400-like isoform X1 [Daucus carota subsp. sativus]
MGSGEKKKARTRAFPQQLGDEDRLSRLPDELIHKILSFVDAKQAVETCTLSRRWQLLWTTLPFLQIGPYQISESKYVANFIRRIFSDRNPQSNISDLKFRVYNATCSWNFFEEFAHYAISHNAQSLYLELLRDHIPFKLSTFSSVSLNKLTLKVSLETCELQSDFWDLPALTTLRLKYVRSYEDKQRNSWLKDSLFTCLPALTTLCLEGWDLSGSSSFSLPALTTLRLCHCMLPKVWDLPALLSLQLDNIYVSAKVSDIISALVNLKNLTLFLTLNQGNCFISCPPQLLNLSIRARLKHSPSINIVVSAPKLCNFNSFGIFTVITGVPELENVNISLQGWFQNVILTQRKQFYWQLTNMLLGLCNAKHLTFDLESIEVLSKISNILASLPSPFSKLEYVKLPRGFEESNISGALRSYLLGGSPNATFVTKLPQKKIVEDSMVDANRVCHTDAM